MLLVFSYICKKKNEKKNTFFEIKNNENTTTIHKQNNLSNNYNKLKSVCCVGSLSRYSAFFLVGRLESERTKHDVNVSSDDQTENKQTNNMMGKQLQININTLAYIHARRQKTRTGIYKLIRMHDTMCNTIFTGILHVIYAACVYMPSLMTMATSSFFFQSYLILFLCLFLFLFFLF